MKLHGIFPLTGLGDDWQQGMPGGNPFDDGPKPNSQKPSKPQKPSKNSKAPSSGMTKDEMRRGYEFIQKVGQAADKVSDNSGISEDTTERNMTPAQAKELAAGIKLADTVIKEGMKVRDLAKKDTSGTGDEIKKLSLKATDPINEDRGFGVKEKHDAAVALAEALKRKAELATLGKAAADGWSWLVKSVANSASDAWSEYSARKIAEEKAKYEKFQKEMEQEDERRRQKRSEDERQRLERAKKIQEELAQQKRERNQALLAKKKARQTVASMRKKAAEQARKQYAESGGYGGKRKPPVYVATAEPAGVPQFTPDYHGPRPASPGSFTFIQPPVNFHYTPPTMPTPQIRPPLLLPPLSSSPGVSQVAPPVQQTQTAYFTTPQLDFSNIPSYTPYQQINTPQAPQIIGGSGLQIPNQGTAIQTSGYTSSPTYGAGPQNMSGLAPFVRRRGGRKFKRKPAVHRMTVSGIECFAPISGDQVTPLSGMGSCCDKCGDGDQCGGMSGLGWSGGPSSGLAAALTPYIVAAGVLGYLMLKK